jgi:hypothetical protein
MHYISAAHYFDPVNETMIDTGAGTRQSPVRADAVSPSFVPIRLFATVLGLQLGLVVLLLLLLV